MKIIVGLGNPTPKYRNNYHNLGFMTADALAEKLKMKIKTSECKSLTAVKTIDGGDVVIAKPQTFMNLSGEAVKEGADLAPSPSAAGSFNDNMFYLFFNMLYEGENPDRAIELVLRTAGQHFHVSRAYIYEAEPEDNRIVHLTYEWCAEGVASRGEYLERFLIQKEVADNSRQRGFYRCDDTHLPGALPQGMPLRLDRGGVRAFFVPAHLIV